MSIHSNNGEKGFSLVELSVLLALTAVMAAFSIPILTDTVRDMQLLGEARSIASTMTYARMNSAAQQTHYRLTFNLINKKTWTLDRRTAPATFTTEANHEISLGSSTSGIAFKDSFATPPEAGVPTASSGTIEFNSRGIPISGVSAIYLTNGNEDYAVVATLSGRVQVWRYRDSAWSRQ